MPMEQINAASIFSPAIGFIRRGGFDWTCNPYIGCSFGCTYCYAMFLPQNRRPKEDWGRWFQAKVKANQPMSNGPGGLWPGPLPRSTGGPAPGVEPRVRGMS